MKTYTVHREYHSANLNEIVNHSEVRPWVGGGSGPLDLTALVANPDNVLLMAEGGGLLFQKLGDGYYEVHTQFVPEARGKASLQAVKDALWWMFARSDAVEIVTKVPDGNVAAEGLVKAIHGEFQFSRPNVWAKDGSLVGAKYYALTLARWTRTADGLPELGEAFHEKLADAKTRMGASLPIHDDDDAHDRYVGAAVAIIGGGQVIKSATAYNRWAVFAGYAPISILSLDPVIIDQTDAVLLVRGEDFDVLHCR